MGHNFEKKVSGVTILVLCIFIPSFMKTFQGFPRLSDLLSGHEMMTDDDGQMDGQMD